MSTSTDNDNIVLRRALGVACAILFDHEPGDSRAVSDEFVSLSSIASGRYDDECVRVIDAAHDRLAAEESS